VNTAFTGNYFQPVKTLNKYIRKREKAIELLLQKTKRSNPPAFYHKLRVEIKKLNAVLDLAESGSPDFDRKKTFKPFKLIFKQAGKVRELQVEENILKKYFAKTGFKNYRNKLHKLILKEQQNFFSLINNSLVSRQRKAFKKIRPQIKNINEKKVNKYLEKKRKKTGKIISQKKLHLSELHQLRKLLKIYFYNLRSSGHNIQKDILASKEVLLHRLGKWHDYQVTLNHLKNAGKSSVTSLKERIQLKKTMAKISFDKKQAFKKIKLTLP